MRQRAQQLLNEMQSDLEEVLHFLKMEDELVRLRDRSEQRRSASKDGDSICRVVERLEDEVALENKFTNILVDPAWPFRNASCRGAAAGHYLLMTMKAILKLPVRELGASNSFLWLWVPNAFVLETRELFDAWGYTYVSNLVWVKPEMGCGNYLRNSHELLLLGVRGKPRFVCKDQMSWVVANRTRHSEKPQLVHEIIERCSPGPCLELFARRRVPGWTIFGNQIEQPTLFDEPRTQEDRPE